MLNYTLTNPNLNIVIYQNVSNVTAILHKERKGSNLYLQGFIIIYEYNEY